MKAASDKLAKIVMEAVMEGVGKTLPKSGAILSKATKGLISKRKDMEIKTIKGMKQS